MKMNKLEYFLMTFDLGRQVYLRCIVRDLHELSRMNPDKELLEIGCGNGIGTQFIQEFFYPSEFIATEFDQRLVDVARIKNRGSKVMVEAGDATNLRFVDNEFDAVIGLSVIHHIPNWKDCIDELYRVIKPNGLLIIKELSIETFQSPLGMVARQVVSHPYESMLRKDEFFKYIEQRGFKIIAHHPHSMMYFLEDFFLVARKEWQGQI